MRIGIGYDLHLLTPGRPLILGGVNVPYDRGFEAHSDGDVLVHAVIDALFGAAALGDIGRHFPDTDPRFKNADSMALLAQAVSIVVAEGYAIANVDSNVIAQAPRLEPHIESIRTSLARGLGLDVAQVSVKAKTNEGVGPEGRGEAISAQAIVLLQPRPDNP